MGHKVNPLAFRIPYILNWKSSWYADKGSYKDFLAIDLKIRKVLEKELKGIPVGDSIVSREQDVIRVDVFTSKSSLILGKTGENADRVEKLLTKSTGFKCVLAVKEIKQPDLNSKIVGYNVVNQIEKRMPYKRVIKQAIIRSMEKGAKGIKIKVGGRLNGAEIARKETFKEGNIPTQTIRANIDYSSVRAETIYGTVGLKIWIYKGDIYKKSK